jgi:hypothetical protein
MRTASMFSVKVTYCYLEQSKIRIRLPIFVHQSAHIEQKQIGINSMNFTLSRQLSWYKMIPPTYYGLVTKTTIESKPFLFILLHCRNRSACSRDFIADKRRRVRSAFTSRNTPDPALLVSASGRKQPTNRSQRNTYYYYKL